MKSTRSLVDKRDRQIRVRILEYGDGLTVVACKCRAISANQLRDFRNKRPKGYGRTL